MRFWSLAPAGGAFARLFLPEGGALLGLGKDLGGLALEGLAEVPFGGVAIGCQGEDVGCVVQFERAHDGIDPSQDLARPLLGCRPHLRQKRVPHHARKADTHVIGNARLARRVDDPSGELGHIDPELEADTGLEPDPAPRLEELLEPVQHVEINHPGRGQPRFSGQPSEFRGRIAVGVIREKRMRVEVDIARREEATGCSLRGPTGLAMPALAAAAARQNCRAVFPTTQKRAWAILPGLHPGRKPLWRRAVFRGGYYGEGLTAK